MIKPMTEDGLALKKFLDEMCQLGYDLLKNKRSFPVCVLNKHGTLIFYSM